MMNPWEHIDCGMPTTANEVVPLGLAVMECVLQVTCMLTGIQQVATELIKHTLHSLHLHLHAPLV